jgi:hypothetical protein
MNHSFVTGSKVRYFGAFAACFPLFVFTLVVLHAAGQPNSSVEFLPPQEWFSHGLAIDGTHEVTITEVWGCVAVTRTHPRFSSKWFSRHTRYAEPSTGERHMVQVACLRKYDPQTGSFRYQAERVFISIYGYHNGQPRLLRATEIDEPYVAQKVKCAVHHSSGQALLAVEGNAGQHDRTMVYRIHPHTLRVQPLTRGPILYGSTDALADGIIVEHCPHQYAWPKPEGFGRKNLHMAEYLTREWIYHPSESRFVPQGQYNHANAAYKQRRGRLHSSTRKEPDAMTVKRTLK